MPSVFFLFLRIVLAALLAAALGAVGYWIFAVLWTDSIAPPVVLTGGHLEVAHGEGRIAGRALELLHVNPLGKAAVVAELPRLKAEQYGSFSWQAAGLAEAGRVSLVWRTADDPGITRSRLLTTEELQSGRAELSEQPNWEGQVIGIGFLVVGPLQGGILIESITLSAKAPSLVETFASLARRWSYLEPWSARSINFHVDTPLDVKVTPVAMVAIWLGLSLLIYRLAGGAFDGWQGRSAVVVLVLSGWFALDLRWQWVLQERLASTLTRYAGAEQQNSIASIELRLAEPEEALLKVANEIQRRLPGGASRLFILTSDPGGYLPGRLRYLLAPHRGYLHKARLPSRKHARPGDYILIVLPLDAIRYDRAKRALKSKARSLPADLIYESRFGNLFLVRNPRR